MIVTTSPLPPREHYGWDEWNSSFGWNNMDNHGDLEAYYHVLIDESLFFEYGPEYDILEVDDSRDNKGDFFDTSARENLHQIQQAHSNLTHAIKVNEGNLSRIEIAHSSVFSLPVRLAPVLPNGDNSDFESQNNSNLGQALENKFKAAGDKLAETFECTFGFVCSSDLDKAAKNPNVGKDLSNSNKVELGGTSSGAPNGWEPQDE